MKKNIWWLCIFALSIGAMDDKGNPGASSTADDIFKAPFPVERSTGQTQPGMLRKSLICTESLEGLSFKEETKKEKRERIRKTIEKNRAKRMKKGGLRDYPDYAQYLRKIRLTFAENEEAIAKFAKDYPGMYQKIHDNIYDSFGEWEPVPHIRKYRKKHDNPDNK